VAVLQETNLSDNQPTPKFAGYTSHREDRRVHRGAAPANHGGLLTLVRQGIQHERLSRDLVLPEGAALEHLSVKVWGINAKPITVVNVYRPPVRHGDGDGRDGALHTDGWPRDEDHLFLGDVNGHGSWDPDHDPDDEGEEIDDWLSQRGYVALNDGSPTRFAPTGAGSAPDVSLCHRKWAARSSWQVGDPAGSDHLPVLVTLHRAKPRNTERARTYLNIHKADWSQFQADADSLFTGWDAFAFSSLELANKHFTSGVLRASARAIPMGSVKQAKPWWNGDCRRAHSAMRDALRASRADPGNTDKAALYNSTCREAERTFREAKASAWREFVSKLDARTPDGKVWRAIRGLDGKSREPLPDGPLSRNGRTARSDSEKAELAAATHAEASRLRVPKADQQAARAEVRRAIKADPQGDPVAAAFHPAELQGALKDSKGRAPGDDGVHPEVLKRLPPSGLAALLSLLNRSWTEAKLPAAWRRATIVPIAKKDKPKDDPKSYRPVSLLSCVGKLLESMLQKRLAVWAEERGIIPAEQAGFRAGRSTIDCVAQLAQRSFDDLQSRPMRRTLITAVDFKSAFDRTWRLGILKELARAAAPARLLRWVRAFLADRRAAVRWECAVSRLRVLKEGVPQGSPLSPTLFNIATASLPAAVTQAAPTSKPVQYADDLTIRTPGKSAAEAAEATQLALDAVETWCQDHHFELAPEKTEALLVTTHPGEVNGKAPVHLNVGGHQMGLSKDISVLGVLCDSQWTFAGQARKAASTIRRRLIALRAVANRNWGADARTLRQLYCGYVRPAGLYAADVWWSFLAPTHRMNLERVNNEAARIITGVGLGARALPVTMDAGLESFETICRRSGAALLVKCSQLPKEHPLGSLATPPEVAPRLKARGGGLRTSWGDEARRTLRECGLDGVCVEERVPVTMLPRPWRGTRVSFVCTPNTRREDPPWRRREEALVTLDGLRSRDPPHVQIWTDGAAKDGVRDGGGGFVIQRLAPGADICGAVPAGRWTCSTTAEAAAAAAGLQAALGELEDAAGLNIWLLFDSRALFEKLQKPARCQDDHAAAQAVALLHQLAGRHLVTVVWIPGHAGLSLNDRADALARQGSGLPQDGVRVPAGAIRAAVREFLTREARAIYTKEVPAEHPHRQCGGLPLPLERLGPRVAEVALFQLRANRAPFLQATQHRWGRTASPECPHCQAPVEDSAHFLLVCPRWQAERQRFLNGASSMILLQEHPEWVRAYLEATGALARPPYGL
jgi:ribonuclease HI